MSNEHAGERGLGKSGNDGIIHRIEKRERKGRWEGGLERLSCSNLSLFLSFRPLEVEHPRAKKIPTFPFYVIFVKIEDFNVRCQ